MKHTELSMNERFELMDKYKADQEIVMEKAYEWALKAYGLNKDDRTNNNILKQTGTQLKRELPAELQ